MFLADVPVQAGQELQVALVLVVAVVGTRIVAVVPDEEVLHLLGFGFPDAGDHAGLVLDTVLGRTPLDDFRRVRGAFGIDEEEQLVLDDRAAQGEAVRGLAFRRALEVHAVHPVTVHVLVLVIDIGRSLERVRTGLGDGVDTAADEVGLTDVIRGHDHLHFLDRVDGDGVAAARKGRRQTEVVVHVRAVHGEVGGTSRAAGEVHPVTAVGRQLGHVGEAPADGRHLDHLAGGDVGRCAGLLHRRELGGGSGDDHGFGEELRGLRQLRVQVVGFGQLEGDIRVIDLLVTQAGDLDPVGAAGTHTLDGVEAITVRHRTVGGPGRLVDGHDGGADDRLPVLVHHASAEGRRRHLGEGGDTRQHGQCRERKAFEGISHKVIVLII